MTLTIHLENGSIYKEDDKFIARDMKENYITYGNDIIHAQMELVSYMRNKYNHLPHIVEFKKSLTGFNFSVYKKGKGKK